MERDHGGTQEERDASDHRCRGSGGCFWGRRRDLSGAGERHGLREPALRCAIDRAAGMGGRGRRSGGKPAAEVADRADRRRGRARATMRSRGAPAARSLSRSRAGVDREAPAQLSGQLRIRRDRFSEAWSRNELWLGLVSRPPGWARRSKCRLTPAKYASGTYDPHAPRVTARWPASSPPPRTRRRRRAPRRSGRPVGPPRRRQRRDPPRAALATSQNAPTTEATSASSRESPTRDAVRRARSLAPACVAPPRGPWRRRAGIRW